MECLGENTKKSVTFSVKKTIIYKINFIDNFKFMSTSLSKLVKYLSGRLHSDKCVDCKSYLDCM